MKQNQHTWTESPIAKSIDGKSKVVALAMITELIHFDDLAKRRIELGFNASVLAPVDWDHLVYESFAAK